MSKYIALIVGHGISTNGAWDCGCTDGNYTEANLMYSIVGAAVPILRAAGVKVLTDWDTKNDRNMTYTVRDANAAGVDAYMSLHCDYNQAPTGTYPLYYSGSASGLKLANAVNASVMSVMGMSTRGVTPKTDLYELSATDAPSCIFETGSIRADISKLLDFNTYGKAIAYGIMDYFGVSHDGAIKSTAAAAATTTTKAATTTTSSSVYSSSYYLSYGDGPDENIRQFQRDCNILGYQGAGGKLAEDAMYGSECKTACGKIQKFHGLAIDYEYGHDTDVATKAEVRALQTALKNNGYGYLVVDGLTGPKTKAALGDYQLNHGLTVDYIAGPKTLAKLGL